MNKFHKLSIAQGGSAELTLDVGVSQIAINNNNGTEGDGVNPYNDKNYGTYLFIMEEMEHYKSGTVINYITHENEEIIKGE